MTPSPKFRKSSSGQVRTRRQYDPRLAALGRRRWPGQVLRRLWTELGTWTGASGLGHWWSRVCVRLVDARGRTKPLWIPTWDVYAHQSRRGLVAASCRRRLKQTWTKTCVDVVAPGARSKGGVDTCAAAGPRTCRCLPQTAVAMEPPGSTREAFWASSVECRRSSKNTYPGSCFEALPSDLLLHNDLQAFQTAILRGVRSKAPGYLPSTQ